MANGSLKKCFIPFVRLKYVSTAHESKELTFLLSNTFLHYLSKLIFFSSIVIVLPRKNKRNNVRILTINFPKMTNNKLFVRIRSVVRYYHKTE